MKRAAVTILQIGITTTILYFLLRDQQTREEMRKALGRAHAGWLIAGALAFGVVELIAAWRWDLLLKVQGIFVSRARICMLLLIGVFFNFFMPGGAGGDLVRAFYLIKEAPGKGTAAVLSILFDRIVGLFALILMGGFMIVSQWSWLTATPKTQQYVYSALVVLGIATGAVIFAAILSAFGLVHRLSPRFPQRQRIAELALAINQYGREWRTTLKALVSSILCGFGYFSVFYCAGRAFATAGERVPTVTEIFAVMPVVNTIIALPIAMNGVGVREELFQTFFEQLAGVSGGVAMLISSTGFVLTAVWGVIGGFIYMFYRPSEHVPLGEIKEEVAAVETQLAETEIALESAEKEAR